ncbi:apoptosis inducing factor BLCAP isoform 1-T1 [Morus bassanus]
MAACFLLLTAELNSLPTGGVAGDCSGAHVIATAARPSQPATMYCLQWLLPVLLIPKPLNPALWFSHSMFMGFYLLSFLLERKPCTICALVFLAALFLICYSCWGNCFLYHCTGSQLPESAHDPSIVGT